MLTWWVDNLQINTPRIQHLPIRGAACTERYCGGEHQANSMAAQREVASMLLHPYSREQKLQQINSLRQKAVSKETVNEQRRKQLL